MKPFVPKNEFWLHQLKAKKDLEQALLEATSPQAASGDALERAVSEEAVIRTIEHAAAGWDAQGDVMIANALRALLPDVHSLVTLRAAPPSSDARAVGLFWQTSDGKWHFSPGSIKRGDIHDNGRPIHVAYLGEEAK